MLRILQLRLDQGSSDSISVTQGAFTSIMLQNVGQMGAPPKIVAPAVSQFPSTLPAPAKDIPCQLLGYISEAVSICHNVSVAIAQGEGVEAYTASLVDLNGRLLVWEASVPEIWRCSISSTPNTLGEQEEYPPVLLTFPVVNTMFLWVSFWMTRMDVLQCLDKVYSDPAEISAVRYDMSRLVDTICSATPHMTGQTNESGRGAASKSVQNLASLFAMRSLFVASRAPDLPVAKKRWMLHQLEFIGHRRGIGQALGLRQYLQRLLIK
jgi:hypothetical protein